MVTMFAYMQVNNTHRIVGGTAACLQMTTSSYIAHVAISNVDCSAQRCCLLSRNEDT